VLLSFCPLRPALCNLPSAFCTLQSAICTLQSSLAFRLVLAPGWLRNRRWVLRFGRFRRRLVAEASFEIVHPAFGGLEGMPQELFGVVEADAAFADHLV